MNVFTTFAPVALPLALFLALPSAKGQSPYEAALKEMARKAPPGSVQACTLITRAEVEKATGRDTYADAEAAGDGGWICNIGLVELKVYSGPASSQAWESTLKSFKMDREPRSPAPGFGEGAYFLHPKPRNRHQDNVLILVAKSGSHTVVLSVDAPEGKPAESVRPATESLMKLVRSRLR